MKTYDQLLEEIAKRDQIIKIRDIRIDIQEKTIQMHHNFTTFFVPFFMLFYIILLLLFFLR